MKPAIIILCGILLLAACGGGGGSGGNDDATPPLELTSSMFFRLSTGIYSATSAGSPTQLTPNLSSNDRIFSFSISPDERWIAIHGKLNGDTQNHLYIMPITGGVASKVSTLNNVFAGVISFVWSPNSNRIVYRADDQFDGRYELFMVTINSDNTFTSAQKVSGPIGSNNNISNPEWSFDGSHLAYTVDEISPSFIIIGVNTHEVGTQSGDSNFSIRVSKASFDNTSFKFAWSPTENKLMYLGAVRSAISEAFWVSASEDESSYVANNRVVSVLTGSEEVVGFKWSDDGRYLAYFVSDISVNEYSLKVYDDDAGMANDLLLLDEMNLNGVADGSRAYYWLPGKHRIVGFHFTGVGSDHQLSIMNVDGSSRVDIATTDNSLHFLIAPDGSRIAIVDHDIAGIEARLFFVSTDSAVAEYSFDFSDVRINISFDGSSWSPDNTKFVYVPSNTSSNTSQVQRIDMSDGSQVMISASGDNARKPLWSPDSGYICHSRLTDLSAMPVRQERDLFCATSDGSDSTNFTDSDVEMITLQFTFDDTEPQSDST